MTMLSNDTRAVRSQAAMRLWALARDAEHLDGTVWRIRPGHLVDEHDGCLTEDCREPRMHHAAAKAAREAVEGDPFEGWTSEGSLDRKRTTVRQDLEERFLSEGGYRPE